MTYSRGDFVDCAFPFREQPERPEATRLHICYVDRVAQAANGTKVLVLYTTTAERSADVPARKGMVAIDERTSKAMGMQRAFTIDTFRMLIVPLGEAWFPNLQKRGNGIRGRAPERLQQHIGRLVDRAIREGEPLLDVYPRRPRAS